MLSPMAVDDSPLETTRAEVLRELLARLDRKRHDLAELAARGPTAEATALSLAAGMLASVDPGLLAHLKGRCVALPVVGGQVVVDLGDWVTLAIAGEHGWESHLCRLAERIVLPGQTVIDVGAHAGVFTTLLASVVGTSGRVYAFEPAPDNLRLLERTVALNGHQAIVSVERAALSDVSAPGTATLFAYTPGDGPGRFPGASTMLHSLVEGDGYGGGPVDQVAITSLDLFTKARGIASASFLKVDVEGAELKVLRGSRELIQRSPEIVLLVELHPRELQSQGSSASEVVDFVTGLGLEVRQIELLPDGALRLARHVPGSPLTQNHFVAGRPR
jgi:FkbM family methyltransferase